MTKKKTTKKKVKRTIIALTTGDTIPENAVYLSTIAEPRKDKIFPLPATHFFELHQEK